MYYQLGEMSRNSDYTTANLLDLLYCQKYYKLMDIDLSRQNNINNVTLTNWNLLNEGNDSK